MRLPFSRPDPEGYTREIAKGLDRAYESAHAEEAQVGKARLVVFSDHHRGARDGADDFQRCERAYNAALAYYLTLGHRLLALGDVEELWECTPEEAIASYPETLELERQFHEEGRLVRFFGNHDDLWEQQGQVRKHFGELLPELPFREALRLKVLDGDRELGELFFVHGHQGTLESDRLGGISRFFVRHVWRRVQRRLNMASTSPAADWELREEHDTAMYRWARGHSRNVVLITGHTHRPVFGRGQPPPDEVDEPAERPDASVGERAEHRASVEWSRAEARRRAAQPSYPVDVPCYFNTGCCSYGDGDITGLEIAGGTIRLVRWILRDGEVLPDPRAEASLSQVLDAVSTGRAIASTSEPLVDEPQAG